MLAFILSLGLIFTPCADETSQNCTWYASAQGNGYGNSFIDLNGTAYYFDINHNKEYHLG